MHFTLPQVSEILKDILQKEDGICTVYKYFLLSTLSYPQLTRFVVHCIQHISYVVAERRKMPAQSSGKHGQKIGTPK